MDEGKTAIHQGVPRPGGPSHTAGPPLWANEQWNFPSDGGIRRALGEVERSMISDALARCDGVKRRAAVLLGISRYALERRLVRLHALFHENEWQGKLREVRAVETSP